MDIRQEILDALTSKGTEKIYGENVVSKDSSLNVVILAEKLGFVSTAILNLDKAKLIDSLNEMVVVLVAWLEDLE